MKGEWYQWNCLTWRHSGTLRASADIAVKPDADEFEMRLAGLTDEHEPGHQVSRGSTQTSTFSDWTLVATSNDPYPTGWKSPGWSDGTFRVGSRESG